MKKSAVAADGIEVTLAGRIDRGAAGCLHLADKTIGIQIDDTDGLRRGKIEHQEKTLVVRQHTQTRIAQGVDALGRNRDLPFGREGQRVIDRHHIAAGSTGAATEIGFDGKQLITRLRRQQAVEPEAGIKLAQHLAAVIEQKGSTIELRRRSIAPYPEPMLTVMGCQGFDPGLLHRNISQCQGQLQ
ncbi:hypothetical protein D3C84_585090 [compost metagenome]